MKGLARTWTNISRMSLDTKDYFVKQISQLTYRQPAQNGVLTDQLCRAICCIHLSIIPMQIAITII